MDSAEHSRRFGVRIEIEPVVAGAIRFWFGQQPEVAGCSRCNRRGCSYTPDAGTSSGGS